MLLSKVRLYQSVKLGAIEKTFFTEDSYRIQVADNNILITIEDLETGVQVLTTVNNMIWAARTLEEKKEAKVETKDTPSKPKETSPRTSQKKRKSKA